MVENSRKIRYKEKKENVFSEIEEVLIHSLYQQHQQRLLTETLANYPSVLEALAKCVKRQGEITIEIKYDHRLIEPKVISNKNTSVFVILNN